jgi:ppGpp synthetase/RelA/SpoT-type nucleotidyltranferase
MKTGGRRWHRRQVERYAEIRRAYVVYARVLKEILEKASDVYAPESIVQARAKSISSFAEKAARKSHKYEDPISQLTDLTGARIVVHNKSQVELLRSFVRESFEIDEANSLDVSTRLATAEFGYLSLHLIVMPRRVEIMGVKIPREVQNLHNNRAEVQIRTLLQHAWADISHDRIYKSPIKVPEPLVREAARLAAVMEDADDGFEHFANSIDSYTVNYGRLLSKKDRSKEIATLKTIIANDTDPNASAANALKLARIYKGQKRWRKMIDLLSRHKNLGGQIGLLIDVELGDAHCRLYSPRSKKFKQGQCLLSRVAGQGGAETPESRGARQTSPETPPIDIRAQALTRLASSYLRLPQQIETVRNIFHEAYLLDPTNPHVLAQFIEYQIEFTGDCDFIKFMPHTIESAIDRCRTDIGAEIDLPWVYLAMARLHLISDRAYDSLRAYAKAVDLCISGSVPIHEDCFANEMGSVHRICPSFALTERFQWAERILLLAKAVFGKTGEDAEKLEEMRAWTGDFRTPVIIVAGSASTLTDNQVKIYKALLRKVLARANGTVISGGPTSGIPRLVGTVLAGKQRKQRLAGLIGYVPDSLLHGLEAAQRQPYDLVGTAGSEFSPWEPLQYWTDLLAGAIDPQDIFILGIGGGAISAFEFRLALALGATVGVIESSGGAASAILRDPDWRCHPRLLPLPEDRGSIWAFVNQSMESDKLTVKQVEAAAKAVHRHFREMKRKSISDPSFQNWSELREDFKGSNRQQVIYMEEILKSQGFKVYKTKSPRFSQARFSPREIERMAEMEHGRWIVERLRAGWRYGPRKDEQKKISPYLVAWEDLPDHIKDYDREAVKNFREVLRRADLKIARNRSK